MDSIERKNRETYSRIYATGHLRAGYGEVRKTAEILQAARRLRPALDEALILDVGFGVGHSLLALADKGAHCAGIEISLAAGRHVTAHARASGTTRRVLPAVGDSYGLPFADGVFDLVVSSHVIEHLCDDAAAVREMSRVLRGGGSLILLVPNERYGRRNELHYRHYTLGMVQQLGQDSGLTLRHSHDYRSFWDDIFVTLTNRRPFNIGVALALPVLQRLFCIDDFCSRHWGGCESVLILVKA